MKTRMQISIPALMLAIGLMLVGATNGWAQNKEDALKKQLVGTWINTSNVTKKADGSTYEPFGGDTKGILMFDRTGYFSAILLGEARKKFATNNRLEGSPDENRGMAQGSIAFYGKYRVNEKDHILNLQVEGSSYSNWDQTDQKRLITLIGNELKWTNPAASGGGTGEVTWKRMK